MKNYYKIAVILFIAGFLLDSLTTYSFFVLYPNIAQEEEANCVVGNMVKEYGSSGVFMASAQLLIAYFLMAIIAGWIFKWGFSKEFNIGQEEKVHMSFCMGLATAGTLKLAAASINIVGLLISI